MLTEKECREALDKIQGQCDYLSETFHRFSAWEISESCRIFEKLICEHFDNPPLKIEELKKYEPIFDNEDLGWIFVSNVNKVAKCIVCLDVDGNRHILNFTDNRFYRKEVKEFDRKRM